MVFCLNVLFCVPALFHELVLVQTNEQKSSNFLKTFLVITDTASECIDLSISTLLV
jgi:hypothetical protein